MAGNYVLSRGKAMRKLYLITSVLLAVPFMFGETGEALAQCTTTLSCSSLGYTSTSNTGNCVKCPTGNYYFCSAGKSSSEQDSLPSCSSSSDNWCSVHSTCHGDCCANGTIESCDLQCGGSGCETSGGNCRKYVSYIRRYGGGCYCKSMGNNNYAAMYLVTDEYYDEYGKLTLSVDREESANYFDTLEECNTWEGTLCTCSNCTTQSESEVCD